MQNQPDLFKASLRSQHNTTDFGLPWNPTTIVYISFFGGPFCTFLAVLNFKRLGQDQHFKWSIALVSLVTLACFVLPSYFFAQGFIEYTDSTRRIARYLLQGIATLMALGFAHLQKPRFELASNSEVALGKLWIPGVSAILLGAALNFSIALTVMSWADARESNKVEYTTPETSEKGKR